MTNKGVMILKQKIKKGVAAPLILLGVIILAGLGYVIFRVIQKSNTSPSNTITREFKPDTQTDQPSIATEEALKEDIIMVKEEKGTLVADLIDVSGGNSSGVGYIHRTGNKLTHEVEATLPDPEGDSFYEGWLVNRETETTKFFSTGLMEKSSTGKYVLAYIGLADYPGYNFVVITLESIKDDTPEKHILEGEAK